MADSPPPVSRGWRVSGGEAVSGARLLEGRRDLPLSSEDLSVCVCVLGTYTFDCGCLHVFTLAHVFWPTGARRCLRSGSELRVRTVTTNRWERAEP